MTEHLDFEHSSHPAVACSSLPILHWLTCSTKGLLLYLTRMDLPFRSWQSIDLEGIFLIGCGNLLQMDHSRYQVLHRNMKLPSTELLLAVVRSPGECSVNLSQARTFVGAD